METAIVRQFLDFFQDFLNLCQLENWPDNETSEQEIKNAFLIAIHIEKCLDRLQKRSIINEFLSTLNSAQETSQLFLKNCFADPPKYILNKIINSKTKITQMDVGFKVFLELFSEEKLEKYLTELMLEAASKETLLKNLSITLSKENLLEYKSKLLLSELHTANDTKEILHELLKTSKQDTLELLVVSVLNKDYKYHSSINNIVSAFLQIMLRKNHKDKSFWNHLFEVEERYFIPFALEYNDIFKNITKALIDCGKLLKENMSAEYFYIDLTYSELCSAVKKICKNDHLKIELLDIIKLSNSQVDFWDNIVSL